MTKRLIPTKPTTKGARTWTDDHGKRTPPHVSPITREIIDPVIRIFPLPTKGKVVERSKYQKPNYMYSHDVHFMKLFSQSCKWRFQTHEE
jgi:hypothetical protein